MTLYGISVQFQTILEMAEEGEVDVELINNTLEAIEGDYEAKLDSYGIVIKELEADVEKINAELSRLQASKARIQKNIESMKDRVYASMVSTNHRKVKGEHYTWSIQKNGGKAPLMITSDLMEIPPEFKKVEYKVDRDKIRERLEGGEELFFAHLGERGESVRLK